MQTSSLHELLTRLNTETASLWHLNYNVAEEVRGVLALIEPPGGPTPREIALAYMASVSNAQLRADLIAARGARGAANFRTRLNSDLEALAGRRHPTNGHARVGNGAHAA